MSRCFFVSDLHGHGDRYEKLFSAIRRDRPAAVFLGGDLMPSGLAALVGAEIQHPDFINDFLAPSLLRLKNEMGADYPRVFVILGNDDPGSEEAAIREAASRGIWQYAHQERIEFDGFDVWGYAFIPPSPFLLKDWERYDVSRHVDPGCVSPEEGWRTVHRSEHEIRYSTIHRDLERLAGNRPLDRSIFLFHAPPYDTPLDRAALDGRMVEHVQVDVHIGSVAIRHFIEARQPRITLHGHVHESASLTGSWRTVIGETICLSAAHDGPELALVRFDPRAPAEATRILV